ncbi:hypothetical protein CH263_20020 [Rhodococcus sp. 06-1059B-a]|nr:hypothetical protein [Rhodococcus sp. 06-1059B-a]OZD60783.1 hypothetical protein CH263_20020 [Rhodococcus sp. 06-1059B-a]
MAAADKIPDLTGLDETAQLDALRRKMAAIPGRRDHAPTDPQVQQVPLTPVPVAATPTPTRTVVDKAEGGDKLTSPVRTRTLRTIPVPLPLAELLPRGALARGTALSLTGAGSILVGLVAAASAAGHHVAIIGQPKLGLLAVHEQGGDLAKIALVDPGDPDAALDAASVCLDGVDVVVTTLGGRDIAPTRARALLARCRSHASILICTDGRMPGLDLTVESRTVAIGGIERGRGRLRTIAAETTVYGRGTPLRTGRCTLTAPSFGEQPLHWTSAAVDTARATGTEWAAAQ